MHYTRRLLDRRCSGAFGVLALLTAGAAGASCSSSGDDGAPFPSADAAADVSRTPDAPEVDAAPDREAPPFDGGPLPIVCASASCATSLVTTRGDSDSDRAEGFCALLHDGTVACWGAGTAGQLGRGDDAAAVDSATAARVAGLAKVVSLDHTCAVDETGAAYCWGTGPFLRSPAVGSTTERTPIKLAIPPATKVAVGVAAGCALVSGGVLCWGSNRHGQLSPLESEPSSAVLPPRAIELLAGAPPRDLVAGNATFVVRADGAVVSWGANPPLARVSSLFPDPYPLPSALSGVMALDVADNNACAAAAGVGYCWGTAAPEPSESDNDAPRVARALPTPVVTPEPVVQIATIPTVAGLETETAPSARTPRWCAVGAAGAVYCWGYNDGGQAGNGTKEYAHDAVRVVGLPGPAAAVKTTPGATCALLASGKVYCWGTNFYGQLGNGTIKVSSLTPQEVVLP